MTVSTLPAARARAGTPTADTVYREVLRAAAALVLAVAAVIVVETARGAAPAIHRFGWGFLTGTAWDPVTEHFGALPYVAGTLMSSLLALALALPLCLGAAVYLSEIASPRLGDVMAFLTELLAAVPSIVFGLWGLFVLAPWLRSGIEPWLTAHLGFLPLFRGFPFGIGMLNAVIVLAMMIAPTLISISREVLLATPSSLREAALALGATRAEAIGVALSAARPGILGAVILALGRALGETMAVTMVIGNSNAMSWSLLSPSATMSSVIANEFAEATSRLHASALIEIALVLFTLTLLVNALARLLVSWTTAGRADAAQP
ncbi:MAG TPA: phosphate ABC transporter permease subunit PstC [Dongiaceae bacterium]|nr:phosphate ABC transporter permease subunit PstC [Dongiaceae bacterium]